MIGKTILHYKILSKLGEGGMGVVYKAQDTKLERTVALKFLPVDVALDDELRKRFINEARTASALNHPNICTIHAVEDSEEQPFIAMEFVEGRELKETMGVYREAPMPIDEVIDYATQVAEGLQAAYKKGIVHRDIKPANIMVTSDGLVKVMDFGLAKRKGQAELTKTGSTLGTVAYMSPEQAKNEPVDHRSDIFSFGAVLYELCSGRQPFAGDYEAATLYSVVHEEVEALPDNVPSELQNVVLKCLQKKPQDRYESAERVLLDLRVIKSGVGSGTRPEAVSQKQKSGNRAVFALAGAAVVLIALVVTQWADLFKPDQTVPRLTNPRQMTSAIGVEDTPSWSPDGERITYASQQSGNWDVWVKQLAGGEPVNLTSDNPGDDFAPSLSPDGSQIAFYSDRNGLGVYVMPAIGGIPRKVAAPEQKWVHVVDWSPDGQKLAYVASGDFSSDWYMEILTLETGAKQRIRLPSAQAPGDLRWSPDGGTFAYTKGMNSYPAAQAQSIMSLRIADSTHQEMTAWLHYDFYPSWSSDGRTLFFLSNRGGAMDLWQVALDGQGKPDSAPIAVTAGLGMRSAVFSPDGKKVVYSKGRKVANLWRVPISAPGAQPAIWADAEQITFEQAYIEEVDLSPDGQQIFFDSDRGGNQDLWVMSIEGKDLQQLTTDPTADFGPRVSPDGREIAFYAYRSGNRDIWVMPAAGGAARQLNHHPAEDFWPRWSPDGHQLTFGSLRSGKAAVWLMSSDGGEPLQVTEGFEALWWPDGKWIVYFAGEDQGIMRSSVIDGNAESLTSRNKGAIIPRMRWSADEKKIYVMMLLEEAINIWSLTVSGGAMQQLTDLKGRYGRLGSFALATDGEYLYFTWEEELGDIWVMDVEQEN